MTTAKRDPPTVQATVDGLRRSWGDQPITVFREPDCEVEVQDCGRVTRPNHLAGEAMPHSEEGKFGNFGNWIQTARDILENTTAEVIMICEDDILIAPNIRHFVEEQLWPSTDCGVVSLYCPAMTQYRTTVRGLNETRIKLREPMGSMENLVGALALLFLPAVLRSIVYDDSVHGWRGSHSQSRDSRTKLWERKAIDTWIGRTILKLGYKAYHFYPSLVEHAGDVSSMGHSGNHNVRSARSFVGVNADVYRIFH